MPNLDPAIIDAVNGGRVDDIEVLIDVFGAEAFSLNEEGTGRNICHLAACAPSSTRALIAKFVSKLGMTYFIAMLDATDSEGKTPYNLAQGLGAGSSVLSSLSSSNYGCGAGSGAGSGTVDTTVDADYAEALRIREEEQEKLRMARIREEAASDALLAAMYAAGNSYSVAKTTTYDADAALAMALQEEEYGSLAVRREVAAWARDIRALDDEHMAIKAELAAVTAKLGPILSATTNVHTLSHGGGSIMPQVNAAIDRIVFLQGKYGIENMGSFDAACDEMVAMAEELGKTNAVASLVAVRAMADVEPESGLRVKDTLRTLWSVAKTLGAEQRGLIIDNLQRNIEDGGGCLPGIAVRLAQPALMLLDCMLGNIEMAVERNTVEASRTAAATTSRRYVHRS